MDRSFLIIVGVSFASVGLMVALRSGVSILTLFFLALPFPLALGGEQGAGNVSASDAIVGLATVTLLSQSRFRLGGAGQAVMGFLSIAALSSLLSNPFREVTLGLGRMFLVTVVPLVILASVADPLYELRRGLIAYCISTTVLAGISMMSFAVGGIEASMYTLGINKNSLGPIFGTAVVILYVALTTNPFQDRRRLTIVYGMLGACSIGLLLCLSRGGWVGTGASLMVVLLLTGRVKPAIIGAVFLVPLLAVVWSKLPEERVSYATNISTDSYVLRTRLDSMGQAMDAFKSSPVLGVGIGLERRVEPHNVVILTLGETGVAGVAAFATMVGTAVWTLLTAVRRFRTGDPRRALMLAALGTFTVYHVQTLIDVYWRRGVGALSWACVGTAVAVLARSDERRPRPEPIHPSNMPTPPLV